MLANALTLSNCWKKRFKLVCVSRDISSLKCLPRAEMNPDSNLSNSWEIRVLLLTGRDNEKKKLFQWQTVQFKANFSLSIPKIYFKMKFFYWKICETEFVTKWKVYKYLFCQYIFRLLTDIFKTVNRIRYSFSFNILW